MRVKLVKVLGLAFALSSGVSAVAQGLNWSTPVNNGNTASPPGGVSGRPAISVTELNGFIYGAYTINDTTQEIMIVKNGGKGTTFSNYGYVSLIKDSQGRPFPETSNHTSPALVALGSYLYLAYTDTNGLNRIISSTDGGNWTGPSQLSQAGGLPAGTLANPALTADPSTGTIYAAYTNGQYYSPIVCSWVPFSGRNATCSQYYNLDTANFGPALAFWNGTLYYGYEQRNNNHCLFFFKFSPSNLANPTAWNPNGCLDQTSAAPSMAVVNNQLYVAFRTNDSDAKFILRVSTNGGASLNYAQNVGFTMDGYPGIVNTSGTGDGNGLMNVYPRYNVVYASIGH